MRLAAYLRVSTDAQTDGLGLDVQEATIRTWAHAHGHTITATFTDARVSGSNGLDTRTGLADALGALKAIEAPAVHESKVDDALTPDEARALLRAAADGPYEALVTVVLAVGFRKGEALALRWDDLDLDGGTLTVRATLKRRPGKGLVLDTPKTARGRRTIPLPDVCARALRGHRRTQAAVRLAAGSHGHDTGHVFTAPSARRWTPTS